MHIFMILMKLNSLKGFTYKNESQDNIEPKKISLAQRYFQDVQTSTVHFVALTVNKDKRKPPFLRGGWGDLNSSINK